MSFVVGVKVMTKEFVRFIVVFNFEPVGVNVAPVEIVPEPEIIFV
jgi:hypothetical protein